MSHAPSEEDLFLQGHGNLEAAKKQRVPLADQDTPIQQDHLSGKFNAITLYKFKFGRPSYITII